MRLLAVVLLLACVPAGRTQYPYPVLPPAPVLAGSTPGANLRNTATVVRAQADAIRRGTQDWGRRAGSLGYRNEYFLQDYANMSQQFQVLRQYVSSMNAIAAQTGQARAANAVAELDNGLAMISELFTFLQNQFNAGILDRQTLVRTCRTLDQAMQEWQRELLKLNSRIGLVW
jgi:hypothetical protein